MKCKKAGVLVCAAALMATSAAYAEQAWIKRAAVLRAEQSPAAEGVFNVFKGAKVNVLGREAGWVQVDVAGHSGWVAADSVSVREVKPDPSLGGESNASTMSTAAVARGLQPQAEEFGRNEHLNPAGVNEMQQIRKSITGKMLKDFIAVGAFDSSRKAGHPPTTTDAK